MPTPLGSLNSLEQLDALLQTASVTQAARRLGLSVPAVSHALARLRVQFGDPLLVRAGRSMVLTPRAEQLRDEVATVVAQARQVFASTAPFDPAGMDRTFTVAASDYVLHVVGLALEERLKAGAPELSLRVVPNRVDDPQLVREGGLDLAIGIYGTLPPELRTRPLLKDRLICAVRANHNFAQVESVELATWVQAAHLQIAPRGQPGGYVDDTLASLGLRRRVARAVPYFETALRWVAHTDYVLTVSERMARDAADRYNLHLFEVPMPLQPFVLSMVWHPRFDADRGHAWLREQCLGASVGLQQSFDRTAERRSLDEGDPTTGHGRRTRRRS